MGKGSYRKTRVVLMGLSDIDSRNSSLKGNLFHLIAESMQKRCPDIFTRLNERQAIRQI